jgi:chromosome segregation protein
VDRTVIHFDHDVIGIVGPNGCGKSNIVDAIRWCMGEQSPKHLRGKTMEDVIFNGSESRGPHGFAEVTITFDNTDVAYARTLPPEYAAFSEIAVARRLFRDGTSEYLVNRKWSACATSRSVSGDRRRLEPTRSSSRGGIKDRPFRPEDRRVFVKAAGITNYQKHRRDGGRWSKRGRIFCASPAYAELDRTLFVEAPGGKAERFVVIAKSSGSSCQNALALRIIVVDRIGWRRFANAEQAVARA